MTRDQIIEWAREAGIDWHKHWGDDEANRLEAFAAMVAAAERTACARHFEVAIRNAVAAEREECAKVCDSFGRRGMHPAECAAAIRARQP